MCKINKIAINYAMKKCKVKNIIHNRLFVALKPPMSRVWQFLAQSQWNAPIILWQMW